MDNIEIPVTGFCVVCCCSRILNGVNWCVKEKGENMSKKKEERQLQIRQILEEKEKIKEDKKEPAPVQDKAHGKPVLFDCGIKSCYSASSIWARRALNSFISL